MFGLTEAFVEENPNTTLALTKALIRAAMWLDDDDNANRAEAVEILSRSEYVGADAEVIANSMTGTFEYEKGDTRAVPDFNVFFRYNASYPFYSDAVWYLTQMRRWGQIAEAQPDSWYDETAKSVYKPEIYLEAAAQMLVDEGHRRRGRLPLGHRRLQGARPPSSSTASNTTAASPTPTSPKLPIGLKDGQTVSNAGVQG